MTSEKREALNNLRDSIDILREYLDEIEQVVMDELFIDDIESARTFNPFEDDCETA